MDVCRLNNGHNNNDISFTDDQRKAVDGILQFIADDFNPANYIVGLIGAGGVGKTFVTNYIINNCKYSPSVIKTCAPTHKACRVLSEAIGGKKCDTIQSTFGFRLDMRLEDFDPNNLQFNAMANHKLDATRVLIIDEASMIPAKIITHIRKVCKDLAVKIIFIGDDFQLAPVNESKSTAFAVCSKIFRLEEIVRQGEDNPIRKLLDMIRDDINNNTYNFITYVQQNNGEEVYNDNGEGYKICGNVSFENLITQSFNDVEFSKNIDKYKVIAYTNIAVANWNSFIRNTIITDSEKGIITKHDLIMSYQTILNNFLDVVINNSEEYIIHDIVNFVDNVHQLKGYLIRFQLVHGGKITEPLFVIDHTDKYTIVRYHQLISEMVATAKKSTAGTRSSNWKRYFDFKKKYLLAANVLDSRGNIVYQRDLDYGFAISSHKSQGSTYDNVYVDMNDMLFDKNGKIRLDYNDLIRRLYVACSRPKKKLVLCYGK